MSEKSPSTIRANETLAVMMEVYCKGHHKVERKEKGVTITAGSKEVVVCPECAELYEYSTFRTDHCRWKENKPNCKDCPYHCYKPGRLEEIRNVMKYAGPRMIVVNPNMVREHVMNLRSNGEKDPRK